MATRRTATTEAEAPPARPWLADEPSQFMRLEREVEQEFHPRLLASLQNKVNGVAEATRSTVPLCPHCRLQMGTHDSRSVSWQARFGRLRVDVTRYRCHRCEYECRPLLDVLGVEPGRISGSLARLLTLLAMVTPYSLAARLAWLLLGVTVSPMGIWRVTQRLGQAAAAYSEQLSRYHADSRSVGAPIDHAPSAVVLGVDGCVVGMQVRTRRRRRTGEQPLPALPPIEAGHFREVKTGVLLRPEDRVETSPGRRSVVKRFLVTCLGEADEIFRRLYAQVRELGWIGSHMRAVRLRPIPHIHAHVEAQTELLSLHRFPYRGSDRRRWRRLDLEPSHNVCTPL